MEKYLQTLANTYVTERKQVLSVFAKPGVQLIIESYILYYCTYWYTTTNTVSYRIFDGGGDFIVLGGGHV